MIWLWLVALALVGFALFSFNKANTKPNSWDRFEWALAAVISFVLAWLVSLAAVYFAARQ